MPNDFFEDRGDRLQQLVGFFACKPLEWNSRLPQMSYSITYLAQSTSLSSNWPLFAVMYELWISLNYTGLDRTEVRLRSLAQLRILLEIIWDAGTVEHVGWDVGNADRWDDYWTLVNRLAIESCSSLGWSPVCEKEFPLKELMSVTYVKGER